MARPPINVVFSGAKPLLIELDGKRYHLRAGRPLPVEPDVLVKLQAKPAYLRAARLGEVEPVPAEVLAEREKAAAEASATRKAALKAEKAVAP